jgi:hypothetical protein
LTNKKALFFVPNSGPVERESPMCADKTLRTGCFVSCAIVALNEALAYATRASFRGDYISLAVEDMLNETRHDSYESI